MRVRANLVTIAVVAVLALFPACASRIATAHVQPSSSATTTAHISKPPPLTFPASTTPTAPPARPCAAADLEAALVGLQGATGNLAGPVRVGNRSSSPCRLYGPVSFAAYYADGRLDANAKRTGLESSLLVTLPAHGMSTSITTGSSTYLVLLLVAPEAGADGRDCYDELPHGPTTFVFGFRDVQLTAANVNRGNPGRFTKISGCAGRIYVDGVILPDVQ